MDNIRRCIPNLSSENNSRIKSVISENIDTIDSIIDSTIITLSKLESIVSDISDHNEQQFEVLYYKIEYCRRRIAALKAHRLNLICKENAIIR